MLGSIISGIGSVVGGLLGRDATRRANEQQMESLRHGVQWRVEDAKRAGIHPLAALGANLQSFSPVSVGDPLGEGLARASQDIGAAVNRTNPQKLTAFAEAAQSLTLKKMDLENTLLASQIARMNQTSAPSTPTINQRWLIPGQGQAASFGSELTGVPGISIGIKDDPLKRTGTDPLLPHQEVGAISDLGYARTAAGGYFPIPSKDVKDRIEDMELPEAMWAVRNNLPQLLQMRMKPPFPAPRDKEWYFHPIDGYMLRDRGSGERENERRMWGRSTWLSH